MVMQKWPALGDQDLGTGRKDVDALNLNDPFPKCKLRGTRIVTKLPEGCLYCEKEPANVLFKYKNLGHEHLAAGNSCVGLGLLAIEDVCSDCVSRIGNHPKIVELKIGA